MSGWCAGVSPVSRCFTWTVGRPGGQSWSAHLPAEFERRNGYSLRLFLPVLGARLVGDEEMTRRFLEGFRRTLQTLVAESFYGGMSEVARSHGLRFMAESSASEIPINRPLDYFKYVDVPAGEAVGARRFFDGGKYHGWPARRRLRLAPARPAGDADRSFHQPQGKLEHVAAILEGLWRQDAGHRCQTN